VAVEVLESMGVDIKDIGGLLLDEISVVSADFLGHLEQRVRQLRGNNLPWGGLCAPGGSAIRPRNKTKTPRAETKSPC
jgi:hypothetical protein